MPKNSRERGNRTARESLAGASSVLGRAQGQILSELCGRRLTAIELAARFSVSSSAIRPHLSALHGAHLVRYESESRGVGKPTHVYELTPEGQYLLSRAYAPVLVSVLRAVRALVGSRIDDALRDAGRDLASARGQPVDRTASMMSKAESCAALLRSLGGSAEVVEDATGLFIRGE